MLVQQEQYVWYFLTTFMLLHGNKKNMSILFLNNYIVCVSFYEKDPLKISQKTNFIMDMNPSHSKSLDINKSRKLYDKSDLHYTPINSFPEKSNPQHGYLRLRCFDI